MRPTSPLLLVLLLAACDSNKDETDTGEADTAWADGDQDGFDGSVDCDDDDPLVHPDAQEVCDGADNDCDGTVDEGGDIPWYADRDGDGHGDPASPTLACSPPEGYVESYDDCDDTSSVSYPGATEICDELDNDCDGVADEDAGQTWYTDADQDGYGDPESPVTSCAHGTDDVNNNWDCDDTTAWANPTRDEICDEIDNDCDGIVDDGVQNTYYADLDDDGWGLADLTTPGCSLPTGYASLPGDCDEEEPAVNPGAAEVCDGIDNDCDSSVDEGTLSTWYADPDGDGWGTTGASIEACSAPAGFTGESGDCDERDADVHPEAAETCDGVDNDCDGTADEADATDSTTWYRDLDGDGHGDPATSTVGCTGTDGWTTTSDDCDDTEEAAWSGAAEVCDGVDNDCDGLVDDGATGSVTWYEDSDGDGHGDPSSSVVACTPPSGYVDDGSDCDDDDGSVSPDTSVAETPGDGVDQNCDGHDGCSDLNCDGLPDLVFPCASTGVTDSYTRDTPSRIYYGSSTGYTTRYSDLLDTLGATAALARDLNGDGFVDLAFANNYDDTTFEVDSYVYWGSLEGFSPTDRTDLPTLGAMDVEAADLDGDGWTDLVFANFQDDTSREVDSYVYWGSASGYTTEDRTDLPTTGTTQVLVHDFNGDSYPELVFANYFDGTVYDVQSTIYWGSAAGYSPLDRTSLEGHGTRSLLAQDLDADGWDDLVTGSYLSTTTAYVTESYVYYGSSTGFSTSRRDSLLSYGMLGMAASDLDRDGWVDLVFGSNQDPTHSTEYTRIYWGSESGYDTSDFTAVEAPGTWELAVADLDEDGWDDIAHTSFEERGSYTTTSYIWWNSSTGFAPGEVTGLPTVGPFRVVVADLDMDGWLDLVYGNYFDGSTFDLNSYIYYGGPDGYSTADREQLPTEGPWGSPIVVGP